MNVFVWKTPGHGRLFLLAEPAGSYAACFVQYNTAIDDVIANVRFRYNPREGIDFYLVARVQIQKFSDAYGNDDLGFSA